MREIFFSYSGGTQVVVSKVERPFDKLTALSMSKGSLNSFSLTT